MDICDFEHFIESYEKDIYSFCCHLTANSDTANDLYQETVLQAYKIVNKIDIENNPKSFIFSIAVKKFKNEQRKNKRRNEIAPIMPNKDFNEVTTDETTESIVEKNILNLHIKNAIAKMDIKYRIPIVLYYFNAGSVEGISKICNIPNGTVKSRLSKGRQLIKAALLKEGYNYE